ncbi:MAG: hypothetical protein ACOC8N_04845, partial [Spirochaetota bacterium]
EELAAGALYRHLRMGWLSKKPPAPALSAEAERLMQRGEYARALTRFKALRDAEGVYRAYLRLDRDEEALSYLVSHGLIEEAEEFMREKQDLDVTPGVVQAVYDELRGERRGASLGYRRLLADMAATLASRCLRAHPGPRAGAAAQEVVDYLSRHHYFDFDRSFPAEFLNLALELRNYNALFKLLSWNLVELRSASTPEEASSEAAAFLSTVRREAERTGDRNLLALYWYFYDPERFDQELEKLQIGGLESERRGSGEPSATAGGGPTNYQLFAGSTRHYPRAAAYLLEAGDVRAAAGVCLRHRDEPGAARMYEQAGDLKSAGRYYRDGGEFQRALACYEKLGDRIGTARVYERMGDFKKALETWEGLGRERDVQRVRKKLSKARAREDQGELF